jgi:exodeoxyribonuclease VII small subunit
MAKRKKTFEESLEELEQVVEKIESGDLPLDKCLDEYEKGIKLADFCARELDAAEKRIEKLKKTKTGEYTTVPLDDDESGQPDTDNSEESGEE